MILQIGEQSFDLYVAIKDKQLMEPLINLFRETAQLCRKLDSVQQEINTIDKYITNNVNNERNRLAIQAKSNIDPIESLTSVEDIYEEQQEIEYEKFICETVKAVLVELSHLPNYKGKPDETQISLLFNYIPNGMKVESAIGRTFEKSGVQMIKDKIQLVLNNKSFDFASDSNLYNHFLKAIEKYCQKQKKRFTLGNNKSFKLDITVQDLIRFYQ